MDRLPLETQEQLRKMSTDRLRVKLGRTGFDEDRLWELDRADLLDALAESTAVEASDPAQEAQEASQIPLPAEDSSSVGSEVGSETLRLKELELEARRAELEAEERRAEREEKRAERDEKKAEREERRRVLELEEKKAARDAETRRRQLELEVAEKRADREAEENRVRMQFEQAKLDHELRMLEMRARPTQLGEGEGGYGLTPSEPRGEGNLALQTKRFGEMMRHVLPKMPIESAELPQFFETVEKLYAMYDVPEVVQAKLLIPLLTAQAKSLVNQMSVDDMSEYSELKQFLLTEYKLTPREYKIRFETAVKNAGETYTLFAARLRNLLSYYLESRQVEDYDTLIELLVSDRLKGSLPQGLLNYISTQEGEGWYIARKVASLADVYTNNRAPVLGPKAPEGKTAKVATAVTSAETTAGQSYRGGRGGQFQAGRGGQGGPQSPSRSQNVKCYSCQEYGHIARECPHEVICYSCQEAGHIARDCPHEQGNGRGNYRGNFRRGHRCSYRERSRGHSQGVGVRVNQVSTMREPQVETREMGVEYEDGGEQVNLIATDNWTFGEHPIVEAVSAVKGCLLYTSPSPRD